MSDNEVLVEYQVKGKAVLKDVWRDRPGLNFRDKCTSPSRHHLGDREGREKGVGQTGMQTSPDREYPEQMFS